MKNLKKAGKFSIKKNTIVKLNVKSQGSQAGMFGDMITMDTGDTTSVITITHYN